MNETIAALGTPLGRSALAVVRLSGPEAVAVADRVFRGTTGSLAQAAPRTLRHGLAVDARGDVIDEVLAATLPGPTTYTGEHMVEITCHGGAWSSSRLLAALLDAGARTARAGEFTERAFLNGRMDLAQAEAVADVIHAESELAHRLAARQVAGALSSGLSSVAEPLRDLLAEVEARVDFAEDVGESSLPPHVARGLTQAGDAVATLLAGSDLGRRAREGARLAIVGRPNVGKSSLFNALLGEDRAIVTALPGTTRDAVSERLEIAGIPVRLVDTAGMRDAATEPVERLGVERSARELADADAVLWVLDAATPWTPEDARVAERVAGSNGAAAGLVVPVVVALNKCDLPEAIAPAHVPTGALRVSAHAGTGLAALRARLAEALGGGSANGHGAGNGAPGATAEALVTNTRHIAALQRARTALVEAAAAAGADAGTRALPGEIVAGEIRVALEALGEVTGEAVAPDLLERIFARFCVGK
jgi:tRNA modification GTPase